MIRLDGATVLLQWATGGLAFLWITTRHRLVGLGYGWLLRLTFAIIAVGAVVASRFTEVVPVRDVASVGVALAATFAFVVSFVRRKAGVREQRLAAEKKKARIQSMMSKVALASAKSEDSSISAGFAGWHPGLEPGARTVEAPGTSPQTTEADQNGTIANQLSAPEKTEVGADRTTGRTYGAAKEGMSALSANVSVPLDLQGGDAISAALARAAAAKNAAKPSRVVDPLDSLEALGETATATMEMRDQFGRLAAEVENEMLDGPEFPPALDLIAPAIGFIGLVAAGWAGGGSHWLAIARTLVGALFLGAVSDAMLLGHWYLVQPGLSRRPIGELNTWLLRIWPVEVALLLLPTGMISVLNGTISDNYGGMLGWFWVACALTTGILGYVTQLALKERFYSAVMAATGLLYLAILTAFGTDLVARAILAA
jgi:hypothetical protein